MASDRFERAGGSVRISRCGEEVRRSRVLDSTMKNGKN